MKKGTQNVPSAPQQSRRRGFVERVGTNIANNVFKDQQKWLSGLLQVLPDMVIDRLKQRLVDELSTLSLTAGDLTSLKPDVAGKPLPDVSNQKLMHLVQAFIEKALQPTTTKLVETSKSELFAPIQDWYTTTYPGVEEPDIGAMFKAYVADVIRTAMQGQHIEDLAQQLVGITQEASGALHVLHSELKDIKKLVAQPRTLAAPMLPTPQIGTPRYERIELAGAAAPILLRW